MKIKALESCLSGKLKLEKHSAARHTDYRLRCSKGIVGLPTVLRLSHGSGEITNSNLEGIAKGLGINEYTLKETVRCHIGRACILLCLSARLMEFIQRKIDEQGEIFRPGVLAMLESIELLLAEPELSQKLSWTTGEQKALERSVLILQKLSSDKDCGVVAIKLIKHINM